MSNNPQWNSFQSHLLNSDTFLRYKSLSIPSKNVPSPANHYSMQSSSVTPYNFQNNMQQNKRPTNGIFNSNENNFNSSKFDTFDKSSMNNFPPIGVFTPELYNGKSTSNATTNSTRNHFNMSGGDTGNNQGTRETGIIEKLLHSYGFIQCCERQARLFFHFSQFGGNIEHLKIGDPVEFEMTYDRRTGKPIASIVTKIAPEVVLREERVIGSVTSEVCAGEAQGRITYENKGECFFLPFSKDDVEGNVTLRISDQVSFQIATNNKGNLSATHVRLENSAHPVKYQGVVCSLKDGFGAIERADVVKEIFFHEQDVSCGGRLKPGDDVEFNIQMKHGKEIACNIEKLPTGSVVFEDISDTTVKGQVLKPFEKDCVPRERNDPLPGRIKYRAPDYSEVEVSFGEKDQKGDFTLRHGDWVEFRIATDRRDQLKRATCISLLEDSFVVSGERREQGVVDSIEEDGTGLLQPAERDVKIPFKLTEILDVDRECAVGDEVEFTIIQDPTSVFSNNSRQIGIRVKQLPPDTVKFDILVQSGVEGTLVKLPFKESGGKKITTNGEGPKIGSICYQMNGVKETANFTAKDCDSLNNFQIDNKVKFDLFKIKRNKELVAKNVRVIVMPIKPVIVHTAPGFKNSVNEKPAEKKINQGFVAALKDGYGFIETLSLDREMFFHFSSNVDGVSGLEVGAEVEYCVGTRNTSSNHNMVAENVKPLPPGSIKLEGCLKDNQPTLSGVVVRPLRSLNPDQKEYAGLIQEVSGGDLDDDKAMKYKFGIYGLKNKTELLQTGDPVKFQVDTSKRAVNIVALRTKSRATVESMKDQFGFLSYVVEEGRKLFFHASQVKDKTPLQPGDLVEFVLVTNQRSGKSSAYNVSKINEANVRPERLINRLKLSNALNNGPKVMVIRQPKGPESNHKGFSKEYQRWRTSKNTP
ncbi:cold shock domain-containing protein E1 isoform X1 [Planococcus citri]|uniref:cold shock domain-containing protein E1 isoform X1 n=1 Tax=Planococcus citri TaxID=170843 RepID=UPI0031FA1F6E